jgi:hypothetical protein
MSSPVYYRVFKKTNGKLTVVTMQWFDELDCNKSRFVTSKKFDTELGAWLFIFKDMGLAVTETNFYDSCDIENEDKLDKIRKYIYA